jgi:hypothetical protein
MGKKLKYVKRAGQSVCAVQVKLETDGFTYRKWGAVQTCKRDDWLVDNDGEVYSVDAATFARTYRRQPDGRFLKITPVWAEATSESGSVKTKEGTTHYKAGDYLVFNDADGGDAYAVAKDKFEKMYERSAQNSPGGD